MDVWSRGLPPPAPSPALNLDATDFDLTFLDNKEEPLQPPPPQPKQENYAADSASGAGGKAAAPCKVCGDKASGYHYGVTSCEGCKGFFRRSIQKQIEYRCLRDGKCLVIRLNRNRCQFCRFKKCLAVGMSRDSVRYGRVPKRTREARGAEGEASPVPAASALPASPAARMELNEEVMRGGMAREIARAVAAAHRANNTYTEELRTVQHQDIMHDQDASDDEGEGAASSSTDVVRDRRALLWGSMAARMTPAVQQVVEFAKRLPGFYSLPQDDQLILIKLGFFEVWVTRAARLSSPNHLVFDDGSIVYQYQLETVYGDAVFAGSLLSYVRSLAKLQLSEDEVALYCGTLLLSPSRPGLTDVERLDALHDAMFDSFKFYVMGSGGEGSTARMEAISLAMTEVRAISTRHNELLAWCREHWPRLSLPPLFSEIFDIPKSEEEPPEVRDPASRLLPMCYSHHTEQMTEVRAISTRHNELLAWCREHWPRLSLPPLFSEIFDIPKSEEEPPEVRDPASRLLPMCYSR